VGKKIPSNHAEPKTQLSSEQRDELFRILKVRFEKNMTFHPGLEWSKIQTKLEQNPEKLWSLHEMERTGGEPDVIGTANSNGEFSFYDCSPETPLHRRNICYDRDGLNSRKANKPADSAMDMATALGINLLTEDQYRELQRYGNFDLKTSSWIITPADIRKKGGALFAERRYGHIFVYHNSAPSYYQVRGFRGLLTI
jgi:hypothetical protein